MPLIQPAIDPNPPLDLSGKTVIVTGGNSGLGYASVQHFLTSKASVVILACRTLSKGEAARQELLANPVVKSNNPQGQVIVIKLDLESFDSVLEFAHRVKAEHSKLHVLLLNAGMGAWTYETCATGHEKVLQVNFLSNALLTLELMPLLENTTKSSGYPSRLSWVGSRMHEHSTLPKRPIRPNQSVLGHFNDPSNFDKMTTYSNSKLLCVMFLCELSKRVAKDRVIINSMCPGMVKTNLAGNTPFLARQAVNIVFSLRGRTPEKGALCLVNAAVVVGGESHGRFLTDKEITP